MVDNPLMKIHGNLSKGFMKNLGSQAMNFPVDLTFTRYKYSSTEREEIIDSHTIQVGSLQSLRNGLVLPFTSTSSDSNRYRLTLLLTDANGLTLYPFQPMMLTHTGDVDSNLPKRSRTFYLWSNQQSNNNDEMVKSDDEEVERNDEEVKMDDNSNIGPNEKDIE